MKVGDTEVVLTSEIPGRKTRFTPAPVTAGSMT